MRSSWYTAIPAAVATLGMFCAGVVASVQARTDFDDGAAAAASATTRLRPHDLTYLGRFLPPPNQGSGNAGTWNWGLFGLTLIPDCLGRVDPTPNDGYPGCLGGLGHESGKQFGVFDIVPPGSQARQVVPFYELSDGVRLDYLDGRHERYYDVLYDKQEDGTCRIWWSYADWYSGVAADHPFLGYSSCDPDNPDSPGMWDFGPEKTEDPDGYKAFHTAKMHRSLGIIPEAIANRLFGGQRMWIGLPRRSGTRGGSAGPTLYVRPLSAPRRKPPGPIMDTEYLLWYRFHGNDWYSRTDMKGWFADSLAGWAEFVKIGNREGVVMGWREPDPDPNSYPLSDPDAYADNDPLTPPRGLPVCWYGKPRCDNPPSGRSNQPSYWDHKADGTNMPADCNISSDCGSGKGYHCNNVRAKLIFYDVRQLAQVYQGKRKPWKVQPYAKVPFEGWDHEEPGGCEALWGGSAYDNERQLIFAAKAGRDPVIHIFKIGATEADLSISQDDSWTGVMPDDSIVYGAE